MEQKFIYAGSLRNGLEPYSPSDRNAAHLNRFLDAVAGLDTASNECLIAERGAAPSEVGGTAQWADGRLATEVLLTPYAKIIRIIEAAEIAYGSTILDIGSGYGRMGLVVGTRYSQFHFIGVEISQPRHAQAAAAKERLALDNIEFILRDASTPTEPLPPADVYFAYDPVNAETRNHIIGKLREQAARARAAGKTVRIIAREGTGNFLRTLDQETWLRSTKVLETRSDSSGSPEVKVYESR